MREKKISSYESFPDDREKWSIYTDSETQGLIVGQ